LLTSYVSISPYLTYLRDEYYFIYLSGSIYSRPKGLKDATLKISGACPEYHEEERKLVDAYTRIDIRHGWEWGGPLTWGFNEVLSDFFCHMQYCTLKRGNGIAQSK
jgi:hypothetical protein